MPVRKFPLITGEVYHVFNRGVNKLPTFTCKREYDRAVMASDLYRFVNPGFCLSRYAGFACDKQLEVKRIAEEKGTLVDILAYCLMPNHFHFLLRQNIDGGISRFLGNLQNSLTKFFNLRNERQGSLFMTPFKALRVKDDNEMLHVNRYIHLNPYTAYLVKSLEELKLYPWSSLGEYLFGSEKSGFCKIDDVLGMFISRADYFNFLANQSEYQRELKQIEHLLLE